MQNNNVSSKLKTIENKLRKDDNLSGQIDYNEQITWMLFLKSLDLLEKQREEGASVFGKDSEPILEKQYRWSFWLKEDFTAEQRFEFIKNKLLPYLRQLSGTPERELVAAVFQEIPTKFMKSPYSLSEVLSVIDEINFSDLEDTHVVSQFYEEALQKMGSAGRQAGGEFYTPRPVIRLIIKILQPEIGQKILDPFMGSAGFLAEAFLHLKSKENLTAKEYEALQYSTFIGQEKKPIPFLLGTMNCILHGLYSAKLIRKNTFSENIRTIPPQERIDMVMTNPPFGAEEERAILDNFPYPTTSTQVLAVQYILRKLKPTGKCGMVVDEGFLFRTNEKGFVNTKKELLEENNLFAIISLPQGVFTGVGTGVKTNLIFFERGRPTKEIWYYELEGKFSKTKPLHDKHLDDCLKKFQNLKISANSWLVKVKDITKGNYDLSAKNPNKTKGITYRKPEVLMKDITKKEKNIGDLLQEIKVRLG